MTERRIDYWHGRRAAVVNACFLVPGMAALVLALGQPGWSGWFLAWGCVFVACMAAGIVAAVRRRRQGYCCPQCGTRISAPARKSARADEPADHYCPDCDVLWSTRPQLPDGGQLSP